MRKQIFRIKGTDSVCDHPLTPSLPRFLHALQTIPIVVAGTKLDLVNEREVQRSTIQTLASRWGLPFYETSAKRNWHTDEVFEDLVRQMRTRYPRPMKKKNGKGCIIM
jgi:putative ribosome biogenesis GTPase RsgA